MRQHYDSDNEPLLSDYFPQLGKVKALADSEILDGENDKEDEPERLSA